MPVSAVHTQYWELSWVLLTLTSRFLVGHGWTADGSTNGGYAPTVPSVAVALYLISMARVNRVTQISTPQWEKLFFFIFYFLLPRCMCHQGYIQGQRPAGRAFWPVALCTSSLPHIWMYLWSHHKSPESVHTITKTHHSTHSSNTFLCSTHQHNSAKDTGSRRWWRREESRGARGNNLIHFGRSRCLCGWE